MSNGSAPSNWTLYNITGEYGDGPQVFFTLTMSADDSRSILDEAAELVHGERQDDYGHPAHDFACTADLWSAWLRRKYLLPDEWKLEAEDVGWLMVLLKLSREANASKHDNLVDAAGYLETVHLVRTHKM